MTYCVGLRLKDGLVLLSDTRTNAGVDNIATFGKMHVFETPGERMIALMTSGNLALSQAVVSHLSEGFDSETAGRFEKLGTVPGMFKAAQLAGEAVRRVFAVYGEAMKAQNIPFDLALMLAGQIKGRSMRLYQIYAAGNFIEATEDTPFLQVGEHKYGKPILDRACRYDIHLYDAIKLVLVSMDSTLRSNLSVGMPIDLLVYKRDQLKVDIRRRLDENDAYFRDISERWSTALRDAYRVIPRPDWAK